MDARNLTWANNNRAEPFTEKELNQWIESIGGIGGKVEVPYDAYFINPKGHKVPARHGGFKAVVLGTAQLFSRSHVKLQVAEGDGHRKHEVILLWDGMRNIQHDFVFTKEELEAWIEKNGGVGASIIVPLNTYYITDIDNKPYKSVCNFVPKGDLILHGVSYHCGFPHIQLRYVSGELKGHCCKLLWDSIRENGGKKELVIIDEKVKSCIFTREELQAWIESVGGIGKEVIAPPNAYFICVKNGKVHKDTHGWATFHLKIKGIGTFCDFPHVIFSRPYGTIGQEGKVLWPGMRLPKEEIKNRLEKNVIFIQKELDKISSLYNKIWRKDAAKLTKEDAELFEMLSLSSYKVLKEIEKYHE